MFLNSELGLGMGLSFIGLSFLLRLAFFKINAKNQKNMALGKLLYHEKQEAQEKLKELKVNKIEIKIY